MDLPSPQTVLYPVCRSPSKQHPPKKHQGPKPRTLVPIPSQALHLIWEQAINVALHAFSRHTPRQVDTVLHQALQYHVSKFQTSSLRLAPWDQLETLSTCSRTFPLGSRAPTYMTEPILPSLVLKAATCRLAWCPSLFSMCNAFCDSHAGSHLCQC